MFLTRTSWSSQRVATSVRHAVALQRAEFARRLIALREQHDPPLTQEQAAELIGVDPRHYHRWESGTTNPYLSSIKKIADAYGIDQAQLIVDTTDPLGLGAGGAPATLDDIARLETKLDLILAALDVAAPADQAPTAAPPPPAALRPKRSTPRPTRAKPAQPRSTPATSRRKRAQ